MLLSWSWSHRSELEFQRHILHLNDLERRVVRYRSNWSKDPPRLPQDLSLGCDKQYWLYSFTCSFWMVLCPQSICPCSRGMGCWRPCWRTGTHWATIAAQGGVGRPLPEVHGHRAQHDGLSDDFEPNPLSLCPMWSLKSVSIKHLGYKKAQLLSVNPSHALAKTCF